MGRNSQTHMHLLQFEGESVDLQHQVLEGVLGCSLQEEAQFFLCGRGPAVKHFKGFRDTIIDGDYQADELSLGVPWTVVQQL